MTILKFTLIGLLGLYILVGIGIYFFQEKLIFLPEELPRDFEFRFESQFEEHFISMDDGAEINLLHFKSDSAKGLILYFHGNAGNLERWGDIVSPFVDIGFDVMIMDYRGYGKSTGKRTYKSLLSDADRMYEFALNHVEEDQLILFGRSIGSSFASHLAGKYNPSKLILETPFYSLGDIANRVAPIYPPSYFLRFDFKNYKALESASCPIYIFHGTSDLIVPLKSGQDLYQTLDPSNSRLYIVKDAGHNDLASFDSYWVDLKRTLQNE